MSVRMKLSQVRHLLAPEQVAELEGRGKADGDGVPNQTEAAWGKVLVASGEFERVEYEPESLILSVYCKVRYTPDWRATGADGRLRYYEVKNAARKSSQRREVTKVKWAADLFRDCDFYLVVGAWDKETKVYRWKTRKIGGG